MRKRRCFLVLSISAALMGSGCIAIPMGTETYTTEYPTDVRATWDSPTKTYEPAPIISGGSDDHRAVAIKLQGTIMSSQSQVQHYATVTVEKRKRLSFGLFPQCAEEVFRPKKALVPQTMEFYQGDGKYGSANSKTESAGGKAFGSCVGFWLLLDTPVSLLYGPFAPYEKDVHYMGRFIKSEYPQYGVVRNIFSSEDIENLCRFSPSDREKIGAWTYRENATHPHNTFWNGFSSLSLAGFDKHCYYLVHDSVKLPRTTPFEPKVTTSQRTVRGPYTVTLKIPSLGYMETIAVEAGETEAKFSLVRAANGSAVADGMVLYSLPAEGAGAIRNADDRAILELAAAREWPVSVELPTMNQMATTVAPLVPRPLYSILSIETPGSGEHIVRVAVNDTSKTFEIARLVQSDVRRMIREDFLSKTSGVSEPDIRESIRFETEKNGTVLVFTGRAFSVGPVEGHYDSDSRRGWLRLRISGGMPADESKRWARENISAIVTENLAKDHTIPVLGTSFPSYRILSERYENGILFVEFAAVQ